MSPPVPGSNGAASPRTRSVGTKLTEDEYARLKSLAAQRGLTRGEWVREIVRAAIGQPEPEATAAEQALLSEVLALTILINTVYDLATGDGMTPERMRELIAKADAGKLDKGKRQCKHIIDGGLPLR